jgi:hypothetical protein
MATIETEQPAKTAAPARPAPRSRPRSQYWDYVTAKWQTASPVPAPRRGR